jgi:hypothetical protein
VKKGYSFLIFIAVSLLALFCGAHSFETPHKKWNPKGAGQEATATQTSFSPETSTRIPASAAQPLEIEEVEPSTAQEN